CQQHAVISSAGLQYIQYMMNTAASSAASQVDVSQPRRYHRETAATPREGRRSFAIDTKEERQRPETLFVKRRH
ncbi:MAG: hypothetical protein NTU41_06740, partial [Chloroflexi bacterium]|nr:hypothetical protein [Chloroflexota bacterium]